jgi:hypothetical protein
VRFLESAVFILSIACCRNSQICARSRFQSAGLSRPFSAVCTSIRPSTVMVDRTPLAEDNANTWAPSADVAVEGSMR